MYQIETPFLNWVSSHFIAHHISFYPFGVYMHELMRHWSPIDSQRELSCILKHGDEVIMDWNLSTGQWPIEEYSRKISFSMKNLKKIFAALVMKWDDSIGNSAEISEYFRLVFQGYPGKNPRTFKAHSSQFKPSVYQVFNTYDPDSFY